MLTLAILAVLVGLAVVLTLAFLPRQRAAQPEPQAVLEHVTQKEMTDAADLGGRLPADGEMYRGLGLYLCRNMMEEYRPGLDYDITLTPDGMFENISPVEPDPRHDPADFPVRIDSAKTRYRGISAALEALARLMEAHGNAGHASEFRSAIADLPVDD